MKHAALRAFGLCCATLAAGAGLLVAAGPASAADSDLGWVRIQPASGATTDPMVALTEKACPDGNAASVKMSGPGIATDGSVGNIVGVIRLESLNPTVSGQLWIPLSFTFRDWFAINSVPIKPGATYSVTVVCRDLARSSVTFGTFAGGVVFDGKGGYKAVGDAAKQFNTELKFVDSLDGSQPGAAPSQGVTTGPTETAGPGTAESPGNAPSTEPGSTASADPTEAAPATTEATPPATTAATPSGSAVALPVPSGSTAGSAAGGSGAGTAVDAGAGSGKFLLVGIALLAAVGAGWALLRRRQSEAPADQQHESDTSVPVS